MAFLQNNNIYSERMPPVIVVNISHGDIGAMELRARYFTQTKTDRYANSGGAKALLEALPSPVRLDLSVGTDGVYRPAGSP